MPTQTTNFDFDKPLVNDPVDEDLWGDQLNGNWDSADTIIDALMPIGSMIAFAGTTAPNARWLLCDGAAVSRTTFATLFALVSTSYGVGDGSTTFNLPDYRGRAGVGLDNLGGASANRITDANADSLNNTGMGSETDAGTIGTSGSTAISIAQMPAHTHTIPTHGTISASATTIMAGTVNINTGVTDSTGSGAGHTHTGGAFTGTTGSNVQASIAEGRIIRVL